MTPRFYAFWAINAPLDQTRLRRQLKQFRAIGFDGVVWHPRFYPNEPPYLGDRYLAELSDVILHAKSLGLSFWLYDEDGWPSGTVGGQLLKKYPADAQRWAELVIEKPERCLAEFEAGFGVPPSGGTARKPPEGGTSNQKWFLAERIGAGMDYFNPDLARHFLELTHERYRTGLKPEAWQHVEAIFCDEPELGLGHAYDSLSKHGAIPWTPQLPELFRQRYGEDLLSLIPEIFFGNAGRARHSVRVAVEMESASGDSRRAEDCPPYQSARVKFWELLTDVFNESFTAPINNWCVREGKLFTAHVKGEEHPLFQVPTNGSCHQFFRNLSLPAVDALERYPSNNFFPRQVSSAARQFGNGRCMVEAFGGAGWGATPEDLERYLLWLGRHGLTDFVMHLSQYRLDSAAMHDWPPSQPLHLTWRDVYPEVLRRVRHELKNHPRPAADTLVIAPNRGIMANYEPWEFLQTNVHNAATYPDSVAGRINRRFLELVEDLHRMHVNYDVADERTVEQFGKQAGNELTLGNCKYQRLIVDEGCELGPVAASILPAVEPGFQPCGEGVDIAECAESSNEISVFRASPGGKMPPSTVGETPAATIAVHWSLAIHPTNLLLLETKPEADGWFTAGFNCTDQLCKKHAGVQRLTSLEMIFADDIAEAALNGVPLTFEPDILSSRDGSLALLDSVPVHDLNTLRFRTANPKVQRPFVWLRGLFRVMSSVPFTDGPGNTIKTDGPFTLHPAREEFQRDLITDGFPFLRDSLRLTTSITLSRDISRLRLEGVEADAVGLTFDAKNFRRAWRTNGEIGFDVKLAAGTHHLEFDFVPNTFNAFGPHHYYGGDWHVVSPDQIKGVRNFADPADAPANTHVAAWHFRRFELPTAISFF